jgi:hypothetical protein
MIYLGYVPVAAMLFAVLPSRRAIVTSYVGGWLLLPVGSYAAYRSGFTIELIGTALPAPAMLVTKAWVAPVVTLALAMLKEWRRVLAWRPGWIDGPIGLWCLWPLVAGLLADRPPSPTPLAASAYLIGVWAAPWLLARLFMSDAGGQAMLSRALVISALVIAPLALTASIAMSAFVPCCSSKMAINMGYSWRSQRLLRSRYGGTSLGVEMLSGP